MAAPGNTSWGPTNGSGTRQDCIGVYVEFTSQNSSSVTVHAQVWYWSKYSVSDRNNVFYVAWDQNAWSSVGAKSINHPSASGEGWSASNQTLIWDATKTYQKRQGAYTGWAWGKATGIDIIGGAPQHSLAFTIPALPSHTISYNANGGSGAPGSQTKWYGSVLTLSSVRPSRTGYSFQGWSKSSSGPVQYQPGGQFGEDNNVTLYAIWKPNTHTVSYNANGGSGAPGSQTKTYGYVLTLSETVPTRTNYKFKGWGTSAAATTVAYSPGAQYHADANITLYAIWELAYTNPHISNVSIDRCKVDGVLAEDGTYALVKFTYSVDTRQVSAANKIIVRYKVDTSTSWTEVSITPSSAATASISKVIGNDDILTDYIYNFEISVYDAKGSSMNASNLPAMQYIMDFLAGGEGIAIGKPATKKGFEICMPTKFEKEIFDRFGTIIPNGVPVCGSDNGPDPNTTLDSLILTAHANAPGSGFKYIYTAFYDNKTTTSNRGQFAIPYGDSSNYVYYRFYYNGSWGAWNQLADQNDLNSVSSKANDALSKANSAYNWMHTKHNSRLSVQWAQNDSGVWTMYFYIDGTLVRTW